jgi:hypothetical protein
MSGTGSSRGNPTMGDIFRSIAVLGAIILTLFVIGRLVTITPDQPTRAVDYQQAVESSRTVADFDLYAPDSLPRGWRATSVRFEESSWHLGVVTDEDDYVGLEQVRDSAQRAVERFGKGSRAYGQTVIGGENWALRTGPRDDLTYVRQDAEMAIIVTGTAPRPVMERYISSLSSS